MDGSEAAEPSVALDALLLEAKVSVPRRVPGLVSRRDLIDRARESPARVVGVTAPAGYGKSSLLAEWAETEPRRVAWASLDRFDDDPMGLLVLLATSFARTSDHDIGLVDDMRGVGASALGRSAPRLASALRTSPSPFVLMLDDLHELREPACHDVLGLVLAGVPAGSQVVTASRHEQTHLPRLLATGDAIELLSGDLALDVTGAEHIFSSAQVSISRDDAAAVTERTEGWPVGVHLAALIASEGQGQALEISGDDRYVADYLYREALTTLPEATQTFLRRTSVLDQLSAPLCDALLGDSTSESHLRELDSASWFLVALDRHRGWYRYHALFREFLLGEMRRVEPDLLPGLHLAAADWYEANGWPARTMEHLLLTEERQRAIHLAAALASPTYQVGQISTLDRWLATLGDAAAVEYPPLAVLAGWVAVATGDAAEAERLAAIAHAATFDEAPTDGTASFASGRAMLRAYMCPSGPEQMMADARTATEAEPAGSPWRDLALCMQGEAHLLAGEPDRASELFTEAIALAASLGNSSIDIVSHTEIAILAMDAGRWSEARDHLEPALALMDDLRLHDYATCALVFGGGARLAVHRGDRAEAERRMAQAMRARASCTYVMPAAAVRGRLELAKVAWAMDDLTGARHLVREIDDIMLRRPALGALVDQVEAFRSALAAGDHQGVVGASPLTPAELRLLPYLQTHLTMREIAERLYVSRNTVNSEVSSIYRKLGVSSRGEAVERAMTAGLLGG